MADEEKAQESQTEEQEKTYEVKDKRRFNEDGTPKEATAEEPVVEEEPEPEASAQEQPYEEQERPSAGVPEEPTEPPTVYDLLQFLATMVADQAWLHMGLRVAPGQKEPKKDLVQAKLAIDTIVFISDKLHPHIDEESRRALRGLVSDLQLNYVRQS